jgi:hypothetical protein
MAKIVPLESDQADLVEVLEEFLELARKGEIIGLVGVYIERNDGFYDHRPLYAGDVGAGWRTTRDRLAALQKKIARDCDHDEEWDEFLSDDGEEE